MILNRCSELLSFVCDPTGELCWANCIIPDGVVTAMHEATAAMPVATLQGFTGIRLHDGSMAVYRAEILKLEEEITRDAYSDFLTGLLNRRIFEAHLRLLWSQNQRTPNPFAVYFIDVDGLKRINDQHGHAAGDALIKAVATTLSKCVRDSDFVARLSGDEFAIIATGVADLAAADIMLARLRKRLEHVAVAHDSLEFIVSASIGMALSSNAASPEDLLAQADRHMYLLKQSRKT
jgi:diguanylate cyclase (GGDEF)-like protein